MSIASQPLVFVRGGPLDLARDYAELTKVRVTSLVVMTAWCGYYFGAAQSRVSSFSWGLLHALIGIGLMAAGAAALNEVLEYDIDGRMRRTAQRPLPTGRMSRRHATIAGSAMTVGGALYLGFALNALTGWLALATSIVYLAAYKPLKKVHTICTLVGAFQGAMPGVLGWTAARGRLEWGRAGHVRDRILLAVPAFLLYRVALSRRLRGGRDPHVAGSRTGWPLDCPSDRLLFRDADPGDPIAHSAWHGGKNLFRSGACDGPRPALRGSASRLA